MTVVETPRLIVAPATGNGTLPAGKHTPVDASSGARTMALPASVTPGAHLSVEKIDNGSNTVTITGSIRGTGGSTYVLGGQYDKVTLRADAAGSSWWPTAEGLSEASLSAAYVTQVATIAGESIASARSRMNAALAATSVFGIRKTVRLVGDFTIDGPLIVPSNTVLDASSATVTLASAAGSVHMLENKAVTTARTVSDLATTAASTTVTSSTAALSAGDVGSPVLVYLGDSSAPRTLATTIASVANSTTAVLADPVPATLSATGATIGTRDHDIEIRGGNWIRGVNGIPPGDNSLHSLFLRRVDGLKVRDLTFGSGSGKYGVSIADARRFVIQDFTLVNAPSDGVHLGGLCFNGTISRVKGSTGDDLTAITCTDWTEYNDVRGDVSDILFEDCVLTGVTNSGATPNVVALYGDDALVYKIRRVTVNRCRDLATPAQRSVTMTATLDDIVVSRCSGQVTIRPGSGSTPTMGSVTVRDHHFDYIAGTNWATTAVWLDAVKIDSVVVDGLTFGPIPAGVEVHGIATQPGLTANLLEIRNAKKVSNVGTLLWVQGAGTVVEWAVIDSCYYDGVDYSGSNLVRVGTSATIWGLAINGSEARNYGTALAIGQSGGCALHISNSRFNVGGAAISGATNFILQGAGNDWGSGAVSVSGGSVRSLSPDFSTDVSKLAKNVGDTAYNNSNANTGSLGVGPVVCTGSAWKSLVSGATF